MTTPAKAPPAALALPAAAVARTKSTSPFARTAAAAAAVAAAAAAALPPSFLFLCPPERWETAASAALQARRRGAVLFGQVCSNGRFGATTGAEEQAERDITTGSEKKKEKEKTVKKEKTEKRTFSLFGLGLLSQEKKHLFQKRLR